MPLHRNVMVDYYTHVCTYVQFLALTRLADTIALRWMQLRILSEFRQHARVSHGHH